MKWRTTTKWNEDQKWNDTEERQWATTTALKRRECLKSVIDKGKAYLLGHKWTHERVDKASDETINKTYAEYKQHELKYEKTYEKTGKALGKHVVKLYSTGISWWVKVKDVKKLRQDIDNDPIIKDQMAGLGSLFRLVIILYLS